uniref:Methyltransferase small domain-containing protein n=1 Tax=viral metagenome TaxID=1070528 RepID=A0A6C0EPT2_9ZZZZ
MTTNYEYILQNLYIPKNIIKIIEPFAGNGDLLNYIKDKDNYNIECYDIEPKKDYIIEKNTILDPPNLNNSFILTNPPYLARNKTNDLYKCFIEILISNECLGGILIVPLNFICSIRKNDIDLRKKFISKYNILIINIYYMFISI